MPQNCSKDISRVIDYIDNLAQSGNKKQLQSLKNMFGLGDLEYFDDFAGYAAPTNLTDLMELDSFIVQCN